MLFVVVDLLILEPFVCHSVRGLGQSRTLMRILGQSGEIWNAESDLKTWAVIEQLISFAAQRCGSRGLS